MTCPFCNAEINDKSELCKFCGAQVEAEKATVEEVNATLPLQGNAPEIGMKWFKFLIYFLLFADALSLIAGGIRDLTGGISRGGIYEDYAILKPVDIASGILLLAIAACCVFTRFQLAGFKKNAPKMLYSCSLASSLVSSAYEVVCLIVIAGSGADVNVFSSVSDIIVGVVSTVIYILLSAFYFDRRKHLFVN